DGLAAGETLLVCDSAGPVALRAALAMIAGIAASALIMTLNKDSHVFGLFESTYLIGTTAIMAMGFGVEWSLLAVGSGMLVGMRINLSMLLGTIFSWVLCPYLVPWLLGGGYFAGAEPTKKEVLFWVMWPATGMMVAGGLAGLALRWRVLARTFKG